MQIDSIGKDEISEITINGYHSASVYRNGDIVFEYSGADCTHLHKEALTYSLKIFLDYEPPINFVRQYTDYITLTYKGYTKSIPLKSCKNLFTIKKTIDSFYVSRSKMNHDKMVRHMESEFDSLYLQGLLIDVFEQSDFFEYKKFSISNTRIIIEGHVTITFWKKLGKTYLRTAGIGYIPLKIQTPLNNKLSEVVGDKIKRGVFEDLTDEEFVRIIKLIKMTVEHCVTHGYLRPLKKE